MKKDYFHHPLDNAISNDSLYLLEIASIYVDYKYKPLVIILLKYLETKMLLDALNVAKSVYKNGLTGTIILGDKYQKIFTALPEYFTLSDHDIHIITSTDVM